MDYALSFISHSPNGPETVEAVPPCSMGVLSSFPHIIFVSRFLPSLPNPFGVGALEGASAAFTPVSPRRARLSSMSDRNDAISMQLHPSTPLSCGPDGRGGKGWVWLGWVRGLRVAARGDIPAPTQTLQEATPEPENSNRQEFETPTRFLCACFFIFDRNEEPS